MVNGDRVGDVGGGDASVNEVRGFPLDGPYGFLSNFDETPFVLHGRVCRSGEHAFQAEKFRLTDPAHYEVVLAAPNPTRAKYHGRNTSKPIPPDWPPGPPCSP